MAGPQPRIITKLLERRQIEADLRHMRKATSELEFRRQAQEIAASSEVIPAIVSNLDNADEQLLAAMGLVATYLERGDAVSALRQAVLQSRLSDQGRIGAMTILQRFLGHPPDDELLQSLNDPKGVATSSLEGMLEQAEKDPSVLVDYVQGMDRQEPDIVLAVVRALREMEDPSAQLAERRSAIEPLRLMAQDVREEIAAAALDALGTIPRPEAAWALQTLIPVLAPNLQPQAERLLRKLRFSGVHVDPLPLPDPGWRALVGPPSTWDQRSLWFITGGVGETHARFLNILLHDRAGAVQAIGHDPVPILMLPPERPVGYLHDVALPDGSGSLLMMEATFNLGRRLLLEAIAENRRTQIPVAGPLRLLSPWLWGSGGTDEIPARSLPIVNDSRKLALDAASLLEHPALAGWTLRSEAIVREAGQASQHPDREVEGRVRHLIGELFSSPEVVEVFRQRLVALSEWLLLAGDEPASMRALAVAQEIVVSPGQQPFVQALVRRDLERLIRSLPA